MQNLYLVHLHVFHSHKGVLNHPVRPFDQFHLVLPGPVALAALLLFLLLLRLERRVGLGQAVPVTLAEETHCKLQQWMLSIVGHL